MFKDFRLHMLRYTNCDDGLWQLPNVSNAFNMCELFTFPHVIRKPSRSYLNVFKCTIYNLMIFSLVRVLFVAFIIICCPGRVQFIHFFFFRVYSFIKKKNCLWFLSRWCLCSCVALMFPLLSNWSDFLFIWRLGHCWEFVWKGILI